jgi:hypothetical protein
MKAYGAAQPVVGMFKPSSLISTPCTPTTFDFLSVKREEIMEFTIPIEFIAYQTALCHGVCFSISICIHADQVVGIMVRPRFPTTRWSEEGRSIRSMGLLCKWSTGRMAMAEYLESIKSGTYTTSTEGWSTGDVIYWS